MNALTCCGTALASVAGRVSNFTASFGPLMDHISRITERSVPRMVYSTNG